MKRKKRAKNKEPRASLSRGDTEGKKIGNLEYQVFDTGPEIQDSTDTLIPAQENPKYP